MFYTYAPTHYSVFRSISSIVLVIYGTEWCCVVDGNFVHVGCKFILKTNLLYSILKILNTGCLISITQML